MTTKIDLVNDDDVTLHGNICWVSFHALPDAYLTPIPDASVAIPMTCTRGPKHFGSLHLILNLWWICLSDHLDSGGSSNTWWWIYKYFANCKDQTLFCIYGMIQSLRVFSCIVEKVYSTYSDHNRICNNLKGNHGVYTVMKFISIHFYSFTLTVWLVDTSYQIS